MFWTQIHSLQIWQHNGMDTHDDKIDSSILYNM